MYHTFNISSNLKIAELRQDPIIVNVSDIDDEFVPEFRQAVSMAISAQQKVLPIVIDCYGGNIHSLLSIIDTLNTCSISIATVVLGKAIGAAAVLASCGDKGLRFIGENSTLMLNNISKDSWGETGEFKPDSREVERLHKKICAIIDKNTDNEKGHFEQLIKDKGGCDWYLDADDALFYKLVDHKKIPHFEINIYPTYKFDKKEYKEVIFDEVN